MGKLKVDYPGIPLMALTATANARVKSDVLGSLGMKDSLVLTQSFNRPNLKYEVRLKGKKVVEDIAAFITRHHSKECGIIYCSSQAKCEETADKLRRDHRIEARHYHAVRTFPSTLHLIRRAIPVRLTICMPMSTPGNVTGRPGANPDGMAGRRIPCDLCNDCVSPQLFSFSAFLPDAVVYHHVSSTSFGMGIDKADVRYVIHYSLSGSLEAYYQVGAISPLSLTLILMLNLCLTPVGDRPSWP